jgi:hypothetical protein
MKSESLVDVPEQDHLLVHPKIVLGFRDEDKHQLQLFSPKAAHHSRKEVARPSVIWQAARYPSRECVQLPPERVLEGSTSFICKDFPLIFGFSALTYCKKISLAGATFFSRIRGGSSFRSL